MNVNVFSFFEIISFFPLKILSSDAKLFGRRRVQFHILHAENFCSKRPKYLVNVTLFGLYLSIKPWNEQPWLWSSFVRPRSTVLSWKRNKFVQFPRIWKCFFLRFINRLAASLSYRTLSHLCFFLSCWRKREKINFWQGLKPVEVKTRECRRTTSCWVL